MPASDWGLPGFSWADRRPWLAERCRGKNENVRAGGSVKSTVDTPGIYNSRVLLLPKRSCAIDPAPVVLGLLGCCT
jgi:hypothetical protein